MAYTTIDDPSAYFQAKTYTGTGSSLAITNDGNSNLQPDWLWIKNRGTVDENVVHDSVRGVGERLITESTSAEFTSTNQVSSFDTNGFTVPGGSNNTGANSNNYVAWQWKASGSTASNTDGTITSTVSANTDSGFSIVSYTGTGSSATIGHGLGSELACYIIKQRNTTGGWIVYHKGNTSSPETDYLRLDKTDATVDDAIFNDTAPTSSVFSIGTNAPVNTSGGTYIAYCFAEKKGFSKFGSYTGNGNADGTFVYTGFKPAFVMTKNTGSAHDWWIVDNKRDIDNPTDQRLRANVNDAEDGSKNSHDFLSNGFKIRATSGDLNESGETMIYMAFAESPFTTSSGIPTTAR